MKLIKRNIVLMMVLMFAFAGVAVNTTHADAGVRLFAELKKEYKHKMETLMDADGNPLTVNGNPVQVKRFREKDIDEIFSGLRGLTYHSGYAFDDTNRKKFNYQLYNEFVADNITRKGIYHADGIYNADMFSEKAKENFDVDDIMSKYVMVYDPSCERVYKYLYGDVKGTLGNEPVIHDVRVYGYSDSNTYVSTVMDVDVNDIVKVLGPDELQSNDGCTHIKIINPVTKTEKYDNPCLGITADGKIEIIFDKKGYNETVEKEMTITGRDVFVKKYAEDGSFNGRWISYGSTIDINHVNEEGYVVGDIVCDENASYKFYKGEDIFDFLPDDTDYYKVTMSGIKRNEYVTDSSTCGWHKVKNNKVTFYICPKSVGGEKTSIVFRSKWYHPDKNWKYTKNPKKEVSNYWDNNLLEKNRVKVKFKKVSKEYVRKHTKFIGKSATITPKVNSDGDVNEATNVDFYSTEPVKVTCKERIEINSSYKWMFGLARHDINYKAPEKKLVVNRPRKTTKVTIKGLVSGKKIKVKVIRK